MRFPAGTRLGPYEILAPLGAGGMGEVFRARDTRLGREVALKVLPQHLSAEPEVRARFEREARTVSSLNHPNICALFDVGREGETDYFVMELVDGETLSERIARGPLGVADLLRIGGQVADALDRAHRAGVVHRDLKPANIMLTKAGAKLMDFGLARAGTGLAGPAGASRSLSGLTQSPTVAAPLTAEGTIVGTFQYMSPEQLEGREADPRSDVWALGCVLYEMATGRRAFEGRSQASLIAAIMHNDPPALAQAAPFAPPALDRIVRRCMAKDPEDRYQSTSDLAFALRETGADAASGTGPRSTSGAAAVPGARGVRRGAVGVAALAVVAVLAFVLGGQLARRAAGSGARAAMTSRVLDLVLPDSLPLDFAGDAPLNVEQRALALSPDGVALAYVTRTHAGTMLALMDLLTREARVLPGTEGGFSPSFSLDGESIAFLSGNDLKRLPLTGGVAKTLVSVDEPWGAIWLDDERIFVGGRQGLAPMLVDASTGAVDSIAGGPSLTGSVTPDRKGMLYAGGHVLRYFDFVTRKDWIITARGRVPSEIVLPADAIYGFGPSLSPSGELLYVQPGGEGALVAQPVDAKTLRPIGNALPVTTNLHYVRNGSAQYVVSPDGTVFAAITPEAGRMRFVTLVPGQPAQPLDLPAADYGTFEISPDGSRIVMLVWPVQGLPDLVIHDLARHTSERLARSLSTQPLPSWSADGRSVIVNAMGTTAAPRTILRVPATGGGPAETLATGTERAVTSSPDGRHVLLLGNNLMTRYVALDSLDAPGVSISGMNSLENFSPDGAWLAFTSVTSSRSEVYVLALANPSARYRVSVAGGEEPRWSRDGKRLVYRYGPVWYEVSFAPGQPPALGNPRPLFEGAYVNVAGYSHALFPDGRHLLLRASGDTQTRRLAAITALPALLERAAKRN